MDISQLFVSEQCHQRKRGCGYSYNLNALLTSGERTALVSNLQEPVEALYLERALEERLRIGMSTPLLEEEGEFRRRVRDGRVFLAQRFFEYVQRLPEVALRLGESPAGPVDGR